MSGNTPKPEVGALLYREVLKIHRNDQLPLREKIEALYQLLNLVYVEATRWERIQFTTLFARIAYACHKQHISNQTQFYIHTFRKAAQRIQKPEPGRKFDDRQSVQDCLLGFKVVSESILLLFGAGMPEELARILPPDGFYKVSPVKIIDFKPRSRVVVLEDDPANQQLVAREEDSPERHVRIRYNLADRNENFNPTIQLLRETFGFPVTLNLIDVAIDKDGVFRPAAFVVEPDYLMDVTAVAECFKEYGAEPLLHLLKKFLPIESSKYLVLGNIANYFLDELMVNPDLEFKDLFTKVFRQNPLTFLLMSDEDVRAILSEASSHFNNLRKTICENLPENGIVPKACFLEPTFYSERYGLQGRLDIFFQDPADEKKAAIIELKSGSTFMPNAHGLSNNHYIQTLLYDLLIRSTTDGRVEPTNYILYSKQDGQSLRYAPTSKTQQFEALQVRNQLLAIEWALTRQPLPAPDRTLLFDKLSETGLPGLKGFVKKDVVQFEKVYGGMNELEKKYFVAFSAFIAREHQLAKTGMQGVDEANGVASLWLDSMQEKENNFTIIRYLEVVNNRTMDEDPVITFRKTSKTNPLANFRIGDIGVLYPYTGDDRAILHNQVFKCTVVELGTDTVTVRLRSRQFNQALFKAHDHWNIEHDLLDSSFLEMYRALFAFVQSAPEKKALLLTTAPPRKPEAFAASPLGDGLTDEQRTILDQALAAPDYFLLWGPPGTGKTSLMIRYLVQHLLEHTDENIVLLAYTNRAVDEICEAIESIGPHVRDAYFRIGSRYATAPAFVSQLLDKKTEAVKTRNELKDTINAHRIVVATVSSMSGRAQILQLKKYHRVIIDEASQILEPMLAGLLPGFERFILVGDHKQLPAVVVQDSESSRVEDALMQSVGLGNLRFSLFERLFRRCQENGWDWAFARLSHQGRMHRDIMAFPSRYFYDDGLRILPGDTGRYQESDPGYQLPPDATPLEQLVAAHRLVYIPTETDTSGNYKTNRFEANLVATVVQGFRRLYQASGMTLNDRSIGVITPYRAQIAQIRHSLSTAGIDDALTIDTVERYQGGARDIIIISLCMNKPGQLASMSSLSEEGVDRKLNVALTRARNHLVILGNRALLEVSPLYKKLLENCATVS